MEVRRTFWAILGILIGSFLAVQVSWGQARIFYQLMYLCIVLIIFSLTWAFLGAKGYQLRRNSRGLRQQLGHVFEERFELQNLFTFPRPWVEIRDDSLLPGPGGSRVMASIRGRELRSYSAYTLLSKRGDYPLGPTSVYSSDPFGLFAFRTVFPAENSLLVLPYIEDLECFLFPPGLLPGGKARRQRSGAITPHAAGVREYMTGDSLNRIHWPTTARRNRLMSKEFEEDPRADVWIFVDADRRVHSRIEQEHEVTSVDQFWMMKHRPDQIIPPDTFEYTVSTAASIAQYYLHAGQTVGLAAIGQQSILLPAERGERQLGKILETLAFLESKGKLPLAGLVQSQIPHVLRGSTVVLITPACDSSVVHMVDELVYRDMRPVFISIDGQTFGGSEDNVGLVSQLQKRRVPTAIVELGTNLKQTLQFGFSTVHGIAVVEC